MKRRGVVVKVKPSERRKQHEQFVREVIARSLLTLPFASLDANDPFGTIYGYYKQLLELATTCAVPEAQLMMNLVELVTQDATIHEQAGNFLKADIERRWCEGLWLHFTWAQELVMP